MTRLEIMTDYFEEALKQGRKCLKEALAAGEYPYLPVLDEILSDAKDQTGRCVGTYEIPLRFVIGTKTAGRTRTFARNFMPVIGGTSEFATKWRRLCEAQVNEGIRDPVLVWEYMNRFYVQEGNKRVSVLKFFGAETIRADVHRIMPARNGDPEVDRYYEFLDFCEKTGVRTLELTEEGGYAELLKLVGKSSETVWSEEETRSFKAVISRFENVYAEDVGRHLKTPASDALLIYIRVFGYASLKEQTSDEIKAGLRKLWDEVALKEENSPLDLLLEDETKETVTDKVISYIPGVRKKRLKAAFFYAHGPERARWDSTHEAGRNHLEAVNPDVETAAYVRDSSMSDEDQLRAMIDEGASVIFATDSNMLDACVRVAIEYPEVEILTCSLNKAMKSVRTYYPRMYEAKFVSGAVAGALTKSSRIGFISRYPIYGTIAEINAFARGALMTSPDSRVYLEWSSVGGIEAAEDRLKEKGVDLISYRDFLDRKEGQSSVIGLTAVGEGEPKPLLLPVWNWGVFYEKIVSAILAGFYRKEDKRTKRSLNYYWGMSAGAVDLIFSERLDPGVRYLGEILCRSLKEDRINPFYRPEVQGADGMLWESEGSELGMEEIIKMETLEESVIGEIPQYRELDPVARTLVREIGVEPAKPEPGVDLS